MTFDLSNANSEAICNYIAGAQVLNFSKETIKDCMLELIKRRNNGEDIPFEDKIEEFKKKIISNM